MDAFKERFRGVDVLLLDDVQFLADKARTEEELFHTFNALRDSGRQLVMTSDRSPQDLEGLEERLGERFGSGLVVALEPPDLPVRRAILEKRALLDGVDASPELLEADRRARQHQRAGARGGVDPGRGLRLAAWTKPRRRSSRGGFSRGCPRRSVRSARSTPSSTPLRPSSACTRPSCIARNRGPLWPAHERSRCTSPASSPIRAFPSSDASSAAAITPPCCPRFEASAPTSARIPSSQSLLTTCGEAPRRSQVTAVVGCKNQQFVRSARERSTRFREP